MKELDTDVAELRLVAPDIQRDAPVAVGWMAGDAGRQTLRLMGSSEHNNRPSTLAEEKIRLKKFIEATDQQTWMMSWRGQTVGVIWVVLQPTEYLLSPAVHIMIGDPTARHQGLGTAAMRAVLDHLADEGNETTYSRHLVENIAAARLLGNVGFVNIDPDYADEDGLRWQNMQRRGDAV